MTSLLGCHCYSWKEYGKSRLVERKSVNEACSLGYGAKGECQGLVALVGEKHVA